MVDYSEARLITLLHLGKGVRIVLASKEHPRNISLRVFNQCRPNSLDSILNRVCPYTCETPQSANDGPILLFVESVIEFVTGSESFPERFIDALTIDFLSANSVMSGKDKLSELIGV